MCVCGGGGELLLVNYTSSKTAVLCQYYLDDPYKFFLNIYLMHPIQISSN